VGGAAATTDAAQPLVRWHGDYYQFQWVPGIPGGTPPERLENRWFRGGPRSGAVESVQRTDLDGDGATDDSRVWLGFSLDEPLNPPNTPARPGGVYYHDDLPSARFYGGLSATFYNYQTNRIQQAYIENDGAGGDPADVGYPSPYLGADQQGFRDYIDSVRHPDGRYKKSHVGPQEDFAINIYRPDVPHSLDPNDDPSDNLVTFHAAFLWKKEDFLGGANKRISIGSDAMFSFESTRWWDNVGEARWLVQDKDGQLYISQYAVSGQQDDWGTSNEFFDPLGSAWAKYNPSGGDLDFRQNGSGVVWINPVDAGLFDDVQSLGLYIENDDPNGGLTRFSLDEIQFAATVNDEPGILIPDPGSGGGGPILTPVPEASSWLVFAGVVGYLARRRWTS
jgi:hypothetical protein